MLRKLLPKITWISFGRSHEEGTILVYDTGNFYLGLHPSEQPLTKDTTSSLKAIDTHK